MSAVRPTSGLDGPEIDGPNMSEEYFASDPKAGAWKAWMRIWTRIRQQGHPTRIVAYARTDVRQCTWQHLVSMFAVALLWSSYTWLNFVGFVIEWTINFFVLNHGPFGLLKLLLFRSGEIVIPDPDADNYLSAAGQLDPRSDLYVDAIEATERDGIETGELALPHENVSSRSVADLCVMAAKLAYENPAVVRRQVGQNWRMHFVKFYNCWNEYQGMNNTQAFVAMDKPEDANVVVVAFRGTEPFNAYDWSTDFDFNRKMLQGMGGVHVGFMEALGLITREDGDSVTKLRNNAHEGRMASQDRQDQSRIAPVSGLADRIIDDDKKRLAYDEITEEVAALLQANPRAKLFITGHSLGGALSSLYAAMLHYAGQTEIASRIAAVYTFGQPRVGDEDFAAYAGEKLNGKFFRVVYCNDILARVPFDDALFAFKHVGPCMYYNSVYDGMLVREMPGRNFFGVARLVWMHLNALWELFQGLILITLQHGREYSEPAVCLLFRALGLLFPGISSHSPRNYVNAVRRARYPLRRLDDELADITQEIYITLDNVSGILAALSSQVKKTLGCRQL